MIRRRAVLGWGAPLLLAGCEAPRGRAGLIDFLTDGQTRRDDVLLRLGAPAASYEGERVLIYSLDEDGNWFIVPPGGAQRGLLVQIVDLTLIFDADGILRRHGLAPRQL